MKNVNRHMVFLLLAVLLTGIDGWKLRKGEAMDPGVREKSALMTEKPVDMSQFFAQSREEFLQLAEHELNSTEEMTPLFEIKEDVVSASEEEKIKNRWVAAEIKKAIRTSGALTKKQKIAYSKRLKEEMQELAEFDDFEKEQIQKKSRSKTRVSTAFTNWGEK